MARKAGCQELTPTASMAVLLENEMVGPGCYRMRLGNRQIARHAVPGQFVHVRLRGPSLDPLLRRPFSVCLTEPEDGTFTVLYQTVGRATRALAALPRGTELDVLGPLGRGFEIPKADVLARERAANRGANAGNGASAPTIALVAGGLGVAPLIMLGHALFRSGMALVIVVGARSREFLAGLDMLPTVSSRNTPSSVAQTETASERAGRRFEERVALRVVTEDGSAGERGLVTDAFRDVLASYDVALACACGPTEMLREVARIGQASGVPVQVSLEERMACGLGACLGCAVKASRAAIRAGRPAYLRVCADGPVFWSGEVDLDGTT
ncbi:MAG: dihydroorotate dehydrogenase electron transfer subunit [Betaproteobacteria bacterium]